MRITFTRLSCVLAGLLGTSQLATAQTVYTPAAVTGYTADVIANGVGTVTSSTTATVDRGIPTVRWCFANTTFVNPSGVRPTLALPANGFFNSASTPGLTYQMASATDNNSLRIDGAGSGTLTLTSPQACTEVLVLATEGNGSSAGKTFTVTFTDGTSQVFTNIAVPDWFAGGATTALVVGSRVNAFDNTVDNATTNPRIYEVRLALSAANYNKPVQSVTAAKTSTDPVLNVMGITLGRACALPAGSVQASVASVCPGGAVQLNLLTLGVGTGYAGQWQSSTNNGTTWTDISGATTTPLQAAPLVSTLYRFRATCGTQTVVLGPAAVAVTTNPGTLAYSQPTVCRNAASPPAPTVTPAGGTFSAPSGLAINATTGIISPSASTPGTYVVTYVPTGTCATAATATVTVLPVQAVALAYGSASYCQSSGTPVPTATPAGGTFSGSAGLIINASTGAVNLAQTPAGTYTASYTSTGTCSATATTTLTVLPTQAVVIAYNGTEFCKAGAAPVAVVSPTGGTFSGSAGLVINASTGAIDLAATPTGTYTVVYSSAGACGGQATARLTITGNNPPVYPNVLTPNSDGKNDELRLAIADVQNYSLQVFSRWGRRVYEGTSASQGWNPAANSAGTYYYLVEYTDCAGRPQRARNWLEVVK